MCLTSLFMSTPEWYHHSRFSPLTVDFTTHSLTPITLVRRLLALPTAQRDPPQLTFVERCLCWTLPSIFYWTLPLTSTLGRTQTAPLHHTTGYTHNATLNLLPLSRYQYHASHTPPYQYIAHSIPLQYYTTSIPLSRSCHYNTTPPPLNTTVMTHFNL